MRTTQGMPSDIRRTWGSAQFPFTYEHAEGRQAAFTRVDVLAGLLGLTLLLLLAWPVLARSPERTEQNVCLNNLREIGQGFLRWGEDHSNYRPWQVPVEQGGTKPPPGIGKIGNVWYEMAWISDELRTPKILVCPSDEGTPRVATEFSTNPQNGYMHFNYRANATSYFLGIDIIPNLKYRVISGDPNLTAIDRNRPNQTGIINLASIDTYPRALTSWTKGIHGFKGNLLFNDGQVKMTTQATLRQTLEESTPYWGRFFLLLPK